MSETIVICAVSFVGGLVVTVFHPWAPIWEFLRLRRERKRMGL